MRFRFPITLLLLAALSASDMSAQQRGRVVGTVVDGSSGLGIPDATVLLDELAIGDLTDGTGRVSIENVLPGEYTLVVQLLGYRTHREKITVAGGKTTSLNISLNSTILDLGEVLAIADRPYTTASSLQIRAFDMITRPTRSSQDLLSLTPGLVTTQHAGGGKAEQIFLRGFDADHGTDVAITVDGLPVNMVSHGHGQGYADLHFLLPDIVQSIDVSKGPYNPRFGNLSTAGAIAFSTRDHLEHNLMRVDLGQFNTASATALYTVPLVGRQHQGAYFAGQFYTSDGPVESPQNYQRVNVFGKLHTHLTEADEIALSVSGFSSAWSASGQIPERAVQNDLISRFGSLDELEGGTTGRQDINLRYETANGDQNFKLTSFASRYTFKLFSNFTFFLDDPVEGDMIEQTDDRTMLGMNGLYSMNHTIGSTFAKASLGGGFRSDDAVVSLWKSPNRVRSEPRVNSQINERNLFLWAQEELIFSRLVRLQLGLRADYFTFDVNDAREGAETDLPHASGFTQQSIVNPKASLVISPLDYLDLFANFGTSFHSNDARSIVQGKRIADLRTVYTREGLTEAEIEQRFLDQNLNPLASSTGSLPRAMGEEVGFRATLGSRLNVAAAAWLLDLENEYVYVGDGGYTELSGATRRYGVDIEARGTIKPWLTADVDLNLSRGFYRDEPEQSNSIPLAPRVTSTGGLTVMHPQGLQASLRFRYIGDRPANEDGSVTAHGYTLANLFASYDFGPVRASFTVENVFDVSWNEAQFDTESRLRNESVSVSELHFTPGNPRNFRLGISHLF